MKMIKDESLESTRKKFTTSLVLLGIAFIYLVIPFDLIPGPPPFEWVEDIPILIVSAIYSAYSYYKLKKQINKSEINQDQ